MGLCPEGVIEFTQNKYCDSFSVNFSVYNVLMLDQEVSVSVCVFKFWPKG